jgi:hypothetical protein
MSGGVDLRCKPVSRLFFVESLQRVFMAGKHPVWKHFTFAAESKTAICSLDKAGAPCKHSSPFLIASQAKLANRTATSVCSC